MNEREGQIKADVLMFRSLASLDIGIHDLAMANLGLHDTLIAERRQAQILHEVYDGIVELAIRLDESWMEALTFSRETAEAGSEDSNTLYAFARFLRQTDHLFA